MKSTVKFDLLPRITAAILFFSIISPCFAAEEEQDAGDAWYRSVNFHVFVSGAYSYNFNIPESGQNQFRVFDFDDNTFKVDVIELAFLKPAEHSGQVGFRLDLEAGASVPRISAASGLFRNPDTGEAEDVDLQQAYVSLNAGGLLLDFGKYVTHTGAEVIEGYDGFNNHYTHSYLFGFAIPFTHTGLRATYSFHKHVSAMFMLVNGWDNVKDNNDGKTFGGQLSLSPSTSFVVYFNYLGGPEQTDDDHNKRHLFDLVAVWSPSSHISFTVNYDVATDANAVGPGKDANWNGLAAYARLGFSNRFFLNFRGEEFRDQDGVRTGIPQKLVEFTITPEIRFNSQFLFRGDLRFDHSDQDVFEKDHSLKDHQTTISFNALYFF